MILVIGGGPAGLMAAWRAALAGREVVVVERAARVGGMAGSFEVGGVRVDHGSHRLHPSTAPHLLHELRGLLGDDLQVRPRNGRIRLFDRWVRFPLRAGDMVRSLPRGFAARAALDTATAPLRRAREDSFAETIRAGLGPAVYNAMYDPYARKLWGVDGRDLAGELARRRVSARSPLDIARRIVRARRAAPSTANTFLYPRRGYGQISEVLADAAVEAGASIQLGSGVGSLVRRDDRWVATLDSGASVDVAHVLSTAPAAALPAMLDDAPSDVRASARALVHRGVVLLYVVLDQPRFTTFDAHYFPGLDVQAARLSEPKGYRDSVDDPPGRTVLCAEIACDVGDSTWGAAADELAERLVDDLVRCGLPAIAPVEVQVERLPKVYPVYRRGFEADLQRVQAWANDLAGLRVLGRQGLFVGDNTHHVLAMGWDCADTIDDDVAWARALDGYRSNVVED